MKRRIKINDFERMLIFAGLFFVCQDLLVKFLTIKELMIPTSFLVGSLITTAFWAHKEFSNIDSDLARYEVMIKKTEELHKLVGWREMEWGTHWLRVHPCLRPQVSSDGKKTWRDLDVQTGVDFATPLKKIWNEQILK